MRGAGLVVAFALASILWSGLWLVTGWPFTFGCAWASLCAAVLLLSLALAGGGRRG